MVPFSPSSCAKAEALHSSGESTRAIARKMHRPQSSVAKVLKRYKDHGTFQHLPRPGPCPKLSERGKRHAVRVVKQEQRFSKPDAMVKKQELGISPSTMRRVLREYHMKSYSTKRTVALTKSVREDRKGCAEVAKMVDWSTVLFSDECSVDIHLVGGRKKRVWRLQEEDGNPDFSIQQNAATRQTLMVFAAVGLGYKSPLVKVQLAKAKSGKKPEKRETITGRKYASMIHQYLGPWYCDFQGNLPSGDVAMSVEDNAPVHGTKETWEARSYWDMIRLCHPVRSPDLNAVEMAWFILKEKLKSSESYASNEEQLWLQIQKAWSEIDQSLIDDQILKMKERYDIVWKRNGGAIPDWHNTKPDPSSVPTRRPFTDLTLYRSH
jgi:transposase